MKNTAANRFCRLASGISLLLLAGCVTTGADVQEAGDDAPVGVQEAASLPREAPETVALWLKALRAWAEGPPAETPEIAMAAEVPAGIPEAGPVPGEQNAPPTLAASAETPISAAAAEVPAGIPEAGPVPGEQDAPPTLAASAEMPISAAAAEVPAGIPAARLVPGEQDAPSTLAASAEMPISAAAAEVPAGIPEAGPVPREQDAPSTLAAAPVVKTPVEKSRKGARKAKPRKPTMAEMEAELARLTREINDAIHDRAFVAARAGLERMEILAPHSLTLLRLRAWLLTTEGRADEARRVYRQILERLDDDENAGVNLAILEAQGGNREAALKILAALSVRHPDSESIETLRQMLGADTY